MADSEQVAGCDIDAVVREVLRRLAAEPRKAATNGELRISERVVTVGSISGQLEGVKTIVVPQGAVITPAAADLLRAAGVQINRLAAAPHAREAQRTLTLAVAETSYEPATLVERLSRDGQPVEQLARSGIAEVIAELSDAAVKGGSAAVLLTEACALAVCLANRHRGVRAAVGNDRASVRRAREQIGVNLLIVNPAQASNFQLQQMIGEFLRQAARTGRWTELIEKQDK